LKKFLIAFTMCIMLIGCEIITYEYPTAEPVQVMTIHPDPVVEVVVLPQETVCWDEPPFYFSESVWCEVYLHGGACCGWEVSSHPLCDEVWCQWDASCGWEYDDVTCYDEYVL